MSEIIDLTKNSISNCNLRQHAIFCKYIYFFVWEDFIAKDQQKAEINNI